MRVLETSTQRGTGEPGRRGVFYGPRAGWVGDVIPFHHDGWFWLYYLHDWRDPARGTPWYLVRTADFVHFEELGEVLPSGGPEAPDFNAYTGSIIEADGSFHLFYTGHNPSLVDASDGQPLQAVMHAVSRDLIGWAKRPDDIFHAPSGRYERHDWRDPFVYWDEAGGRYAMLLAAREGLGLGRRRGCIALCTSRDLSTWQVEEPFWSPGLYITHECPELFRVGSHWYLTFSEFSERFVSRYRVSRDPEGPWTVPPGDDSLDGRAFYAPRTASDGERRYAFGWIATKEGDADEGPWQWAGTMAVHELTERPDGSLGISLPASIRESFGPPRRTSPSAVVGRWSFEGSSTATAEGPFALTRIDRMGDPCLITASLRFEPGTRAAGIALRIGEDPDEAYYIRLEPQRDRMVFDRWPRRLPGDLQWQKGGDVAHAVELERAASLEPGVTHRLEVVIDGSACIAYLDGSVAMSARMYDRPQGDWGLFVTEGAATFTDLSIRGRRSDAEGGAASIPEKEVQA
jgi:beta-fructofuranosidase